MKDNLNIEKLFKEKFEHFEADVNPSLWNGISQNITSNASTVAKTGLSVITKSIIAVTAVAAISGTAYLLIDNKPETKTVVEELKTPTKSNETITLPTKNNSSEVKTDKVTNIDDQKEELNQIKKDVDEVTEPHNEISEQKPLELTTENIETKVETPISEPQNNEVIVKENVAEVSQKSTSSDTKPTDKTNNESTVIEDEQKPIDVTENQEIEEEVLKPKIGEIANVFTPNGDGINDHFMFETENADAFTVIITDQYDKTVYESNNPNFKWDGTDLMGNRVPNAVYNYFVIVIGPDKDMVKTAGQVYVR